jgi:release factor glutamine methyltransferase
MTSVAGVVDAAVQRLRAAGFTADDARRDAVVIARGLRHWSMADWLVQSRAEAPPGFQAMFDALVARRAAHEPVAYLLGEREFYGRIFRVTHDTLIPRPETEGLVEAALALLHQRARQNRAAARVVDIGTGTGCVAITLALEAGPGLIVTATDISIDALAIARDNAIRLGAPGVDFRHGHLFAGSAPPFDLIVSNPPYVPGRDRDTLPPDVRLFEPAGALFSGDDGLDLIRELAPAARRGLAPGGALMLEIGAGQADDVRALLEVAGFSRVQHQKDLQGIPRVITGHVSL